jgi:hypothetical protein
VWPSTAAPSTYTFQPNETTTFILNTLPTSNKAAERWCNDGGGHLAYYESLEQQAQARPTQV